MRTHFVLSVLRHVQFVFTKLKWFTDKNLKCSQVHSLLVVGNIFRLYNSMYLCSYWRIAVFMFLLPLYVMQHQHLENSQIWQLIVTFAAITWKMFNSTVILPMKLQTIFFYENLMHESTFYIFGVASHTGFLRKILIFCHLASNGSHLLSMCTKPSLLFAIFSKSRGFDRSEWCIGHLKIMSPQFIVAEIKTGEYCILYQVRTHRHSIKLFYVI